MEHSGNHDAIVAALRALGIDASGPRFEFHIRNVIGPAQIDLSATAPELAFEIFCQQIYTAGHSRGYDAYKSELQKLLGIRS